jgi:outer membrane protein TolC
MKLNDIKMKIRQNTWILEAQKKNFNRLLERDLNASISFPDSLIFHDNSLEKYQVSKHPEWKKANQQIQVINKQQQWIKKTSLPKFTLGLDYIMVTPRLDMQINRNGKDILLPTAGLSIPLFNTTYSSKLTQLQWQQEQWSYRLSSIQDQLQNEYLIALTELKSYLLEAQTAATNLRESRKSFQINLKAFETGLDDFNEILHIQQSILNYQYKEITAKKNIFIQQAKLEYLID